MGRPACIIFSIDRAGQDKTGYGDSTVGGTDIISYECIMYVNLVRPLTCHIDCHIIVRTVVHFFVTYLEAVKLQL